MRQSTAMFASLLLVLLFGGCQRHAIPDELSTQDGPEQAEEEHAPAEEDAEPGEELAAEEPADAQSEEFPAEALGALERAASHLRGGRIGSALRIYEELAASQDPRVRASALYNLGVAAYYSGQRAEAETRMRDAFATLPHFTPAGLSLVRLALADGRSAAERTLAQLDILSSSQDPRDHALLLYVAAHHEALEVVERGVQQWLPLDEENLVFYLALGVANLRRGRLELAEDICERALERDPASVDFLFLLSRVQEEMGEFSQATETLEEALRRGPNPLQPEVLNNLGRLYLKGLNWDLAAEVLERLVRTLPDHAVGWTNFATALRGQQRYNEALTAIRRAQELEPSGIELQLNLGILFMEAEGLEGLEVLERLERAKSYLEAFRDGTRAAADHRVHRYLAEVETAIELEMLMDEDLSDDDLDDLFDDDDWDDDLWDDDDWN